MLMSAVYTIWRSTLWIQFVGPWCQKLLERGEIIKGVYYWPRNGRNCEKSRKMRLASRISVPGTDAYEVKIFIVSLLTVWIESNERNRL